MTLPPVLLYLHGFHGSPQSTKALQMQAYMQQYQPQCEFVCHQLACLPQAAWQQIEQLLREYQGRIFGVVGSSLGGFLATKVAQDFALKGVLINPAVKPDQLLGNFLGEQLHPHTQQRYHLDRRHMQHLQDLDVHDLSCQQRLWVMLQTGDEVLDFNQAVVEYDGAKFTIEAGGDHSFQSFERHCAAIFDFLTSN